MRLLALPWNWQDGQAFGGDVQLSVVQDFSRAEGGAQDCSTCPNLTQCWTPKGKKPLAEDAVVTNLLVCRIQRNIDRNRSMKLLLEVLSPKIRKTARYVAKKTHSDAADVAREVEGVVAESILKYKMGHAAPPVVWLFNTRYGSVRHWVLQTLERTRRERRLYSYDMDVRLDFEERVKILNQLATNNRIRSWSWSAAMASPLSFPSEANDQSELHLRALETVEDGRTLTTVEYRILKFCLRHAHGAVRLTDWLHQYLAEQMGISRKDVSRHYGLACRKLIDAVGLRELYFRARGVDIRRRREVPTAEDVHAALRALDRVTVLDVAWMLGVTDTTVHAFKRRYGGKSVEEIRALMERRRHGHG